MSGFRYVSLVRGFRNLLVFFFSREYVVKKFCEEKLFEEMYRN